MRSRSRRALDILMLLAATACVEDADRPPPAESGIVVPGGDSIGRTPPISGSPTTGGGTDTGGGTGTGAGGAGSGGTPIDAAQPSFDAGVTFGGTGNELGPDLIGGFGPDLIGDEAGPSGGVGFGGATTDFFRDAGL